MWPRLLLGEDWASGEPIVCPLLEGGPRARRRFSGVGFPCPRLGSGEARSCPLNGPILDLIAPIRPLQLCADRGYQLRFRGLEGTPNYGPQHFVINTLMYRDIYLYTLCYYICCLLGVCMRCTRLCPLKPGVTNTY
jgi:hypothetical protein